MTLPTPDERTRIYEAAVYLSMQSGERVSCLDLVDECPVAADLPDYELYAIAARANGYVLGELIANVWESPDSSFEPVSHGDTSFQRLDKVCEIHQAFSL